MQKFFDCHSRKGLSVIAMKKGDLLIVKHLYPKARIDHFGDVAAIKNGHTITAKEDLLLVVFELIGIVASDIFFMRIDEHKENAFFASPNCWRRISSSIDYTAVREYTGDGLTYALVYPDERDAARKMPRPKQRRELVLTH